MMFSDLTQINVPYGLLDPETREALKAHGGLIEVFGNGGWVLRAKATTIWHDCYAYRVKPAPPQPRTLYLCEVPDGGVIPFSTSIEAKKRALSYGSGATVSEWEEKL